MHMCMHMHIHVYYMHMCMHMHIHVYYMHMHVMYVYFSAKCSTVASLCGTAARCVTPTARRRRRSGPAEAAGPSKPGAKLTASGAAGETTRPKMRSTRNMHEVFCMAQQRVRDL